ncbi:MAG: hypothetical protein V7754_04490 [Halioglobus sp.]
MQDQTSHHSPKRGRPKSAADTSRPNRIVTFVTDRELEMLESVSHSEERSMASVVHRIIRAHFEEN